MNIITRKSKKCKQSFAKSEQEREPWYDWVESWIEKKENSMALAIRISNLKGNLWKRRSERMIDCANFVGWQECGECGSRRVNHANLCRDRLCPTCQWRLARKKWVVLYNAISELTTSGSNLEFHMLTLTCKNCKPHLLRETMKEMAKTWNRILQRKKQKSLIKGWARAVEITYNKEQVTLHPHYHVILATEPGVDVNFMITDWMESIGLKTDARAQEVHTIRPDGTETDDINEALSEVCKYLNKESDLFEMKLSTLKTYGEQIAGMRLSATGGCIKQIIEKQGNDIEALDNGAGTDICTNCGSADLAEMCMQWAQGYYHIQVVRPRSLG